ncbi:MAG: hypothetical protein U0168_07950 [Nannocystaceae bacterium]
MPPAIGTCGWGLFGKTITWACSNSRRRPTISQVTYGLAPTVDKGLRFHPSPPSTRLDVTAHYRAVTARRRCRPCGPWARGQAQREHRRCAGPRRRPDPARARPGLRALWIDRPYATGVNTFDFEPTRFPDPRP